LADLTLRFDEENGILHLSFGKPQPSNTYIAGDAWLRVRDDGSIDGFEITLQPREVVKEVYEALRKAVEEGVVESV